MNQIGAVEHPGNSANRNVSVSGHVVDGDHSRILRDRERSNFINPSPEMRGPMPQENCWNAARPHTKPLSLGEGLYIARSLFFETGASYNCRSIKMQTGRQSRHHVDLPDGRALQDRWRS
jgi:hypothetical protein